MKEVWKTISGYEGRYEISTLGRVKSLSRIDNNNHKVKERVIKGSIYGKGYVGVGLWTNGKCKKDSVHRLVAKTFIPNPDNLPEVNHIDNNRTNNCVENLEWCTHYENITHCYKTGSRKQLKKWSNFKGVTWVPHCNKWKAVTYKNGKRVHIGMFCDELEAAKAIDLRN